MAEPDPGKSIRTIRIAIVAVAMLGLTVMTYLSWGLVPALLLFFAAMPVIALIVSRKTPDED